MTTLIPFTPTARQAFTFSPVLDSTTYNAIVTWSLWGQRWYLNLYSSAGPLVVATALVESVDPIAATLTTTRGLYTATVVPFMNDEPNEGWSVSSANVPFGTLLDVVSFTSGIVRLTQPALLTGPDPKASFDFAVNLVGGFGFTSTLVFRGSSQTFEISP